MGIQINGNTDNISATDGGLTISDLDINQSGISTFNGNIDANGDLDVDGHTNLDNVSIVGVATVTDKFVLDNGTNAGQDIQWQPTNNRLAFFDNVKATFGNTVDLQIFHNGSDSVISHISGGRGDLKILSGGSQSIECVKAGAVNIAHNGNNKLLTTATGVTINGTVVATGADIAESIAVNRPRIVLSAPNDGTNYRHLFGANLKVDSSGTFTTPTANISGGGWEYLPANSLNSHGNITYLSAPDTNATTSTPVERLRITSAGYLNIGTDLTNSTYLVSSRGVGHNRVEIMSTDNNSAGIYLRTFNSGSQVSSATVRTDNSGNLQFYTAAGGSEGERLRITSGGDTTINGDLTVSSGTSGDAKLIIEADTDNNNESDNPTLVFKQDGGIEVSSIGHGLLSGDQNGLVLANSCSNGYMSFATGSTNGHTNATERLRITSGGDVKIVSRGSTTSGAPLYVAVTGKSSITYAGGNDDTACVRIEDEGGANSYYHGLELRSKNGGDVRLYCHDQGSGDKSDFVIATDNSGLAERLRIDSSGNVTKPSHCCFQAVINSGTHPTSGSYLVFGAVDVNIGNNYNSSNGIFTAPVAGVYLFHISAIAHNNTTTVYRYFLRINNGNTGSGNDAHLRLDMTNDDNDYGPNASYTYYKYMNVNDTARVYWYTDIGSGTSYSNADYMKFAGHLVG